MAISVLKDRNGVPIAREIIKAFTGTIGLLQNSSNAANFPCVRGAEGPALRPARA